MIKSVKSLESLEPRSGAIGAPGTSQPETCQLEICLRYVNLNQRHVNVKERNNVNEWD